jgi:hypothetical protein
VTLKPPNFAYQHEQRLVLISYGDTWQDDGSAPMFITVRLRSPPNYMRLLPAPIAGARE